jgi:hypothetical protein
MSDINIDCPACVRAIAAALEWAHGDPGHARNAMEGKFIEAHKGYSPTRTPVAWHLDDDTIVAYLHLSRYYWCLLGGRRSIL